MPTVHKQAYKQAVTITRPANTTGYTGLDVIGQADVTVAATAGNAIHTFAGLGPRGGLVKITDISLEVDITSVPSAMSTFTLHFYDTSPTAILDNAAFATPAGDRPYYLGSITLSTIVVLGTMLYIENTGLSKIVQLAADSNTLYVELVTTGAYTPTSGGVYTLKITTVDA